MPTSTGTGPGPLPRAKCNGGRPFSPGLEKGPGSRPGPRHRRRLCSMKTRMSPSGKLVWHWPQVRRSCSPGGPGLRGLGVVDSGGEAGTPATAAAGPGPGSRIPLAGVSLLSSFPSPPPPPPPPPPGVTWMPTSTGTGPGPLPRAKCNGGRPFSPGLEKGPGSRPGPRHRRRLCSMKTRMSPSGKLVWHWPQVRRSCSPGGPGLRGLGVVDSGGGLGVSGSPGRGIDVWQKGTRTTLPTITTATSTTTTLVLRVGGRRQVARANGDGGDGGHDDTIRPT
ncbi:hypothetical protein CRUP_028530, partial [Coryphaenoides rupestris]